MRPSLTDTLCTKCGLCCDGSLFADVELASAAEATRLESLGLDAETDDADIRLMPLPCRALKGTCCSIYVHRPGTCRSFECRLLKDTRAGRVSVEQAGERIVEARRHVAHVQALLTRHMPSDAGLPLLPLKERCAEALATEPAPGPVAKRRRAQLEAAMGELDWLLERTFLAPRKKGVGPNPA